MGKLADGVYEKVISKQLKDELEKAIKEKQIWVDEENMDSASAVRYLSSYVEKLVKICLKKISDDDGDTVPNELKLTNEVVKYLESHIPELGSDNQVVPENNILTSLTNQRNQAEKRKWERPETSLTRSFLFTNSHNDASMVSELSREIASADRLDMLVSFIRLSGLNGIYPALYSFTNRGGHLRVITTTYMGATDPKAIKRLAQLPNTEIKISYDVKSTRLHAKSYMFYRESGYSTAYVGSSNLSHAAIADGLEWNMKVTAQDLPEVVQKMSATFETYWHADDFKDYEPDDFNKLQAAIDKERGRSALDGTINYSFTIHPYAYQQAILDALDVERHGRNSWRNLVVAATGTGKTAISAFDYQRFANSRKGQVTKLLYIAHRKEILVQARDCFRQVLKDAHFGEVCAGGDMPHQMQHLFLSIQTFNSRKLWENMDPDYYDMIICDEIHHAPANSYQKLLSYFKPKILLGLTATPERMDGLDVLKYFDNHIAAEIRLPDAIEKRLLVPFHYFGVEDPIDLSDVAWKNGEYDQKELNIRYALNETTAKSRAKAILQALERYTADPRDVRGLGFCVSKEHALYMANFMNAHNWPSLCLTADSAKEDRAAAKGKLESGQIRFIFTVDLFNEGVDIPCVNTEMFLRPTNSMTIFLQQLGRGLRLDTDKDCLTVLDFVAQATKQYNYAARFEALSGRGHYSIKEEIIKQFPHAPKGCYIQLEEIAQKRVLDNIRSRLRRDEWYKECVKQLADSQTNVPTLTEFLTAADVEPGQFFNGKRTYQRLLANAVVIPDFDWTTTENILAGAIPRLLTIDSPKWIQFLRSCIETGPRPISQVESQYLRMWQFTVWQKDWQECGLKDAWDGFFSLIRTRQGKREVSELLDWLWDHISITPKNAGLPWPTPLEVYCRYSRDQLFAALGLNKPSSVREGVKYLNQKNSVVTKDTDVFLVTLNKSEKEFSDTTLYDDYSIDSQLFHWQSQSTTTPDSKTGQRYINQNENGSIVLLFVRERKQDIYKNTMAYTFLGQARFVQTHGSRPMTIIYRLDNPIPAAFREKTETSGVL